MFESLEDVRKQYTDEQIVAYLNRFYRLQEHFDKVRASRPNRCSMCGRFVKQGRMKAHYVTKHDKK